MKQLAQGAFADSDPAEELPHGKTVHFSGEEREADGSARGLALPRLSTERAESLAAETAEDGRLPGEVRFEAEAPFEAEEAPEAAERPEAETPLRTEDFPDEGPEPEMERPAGGEGGEGTGGEAEPPSGKAPAEGVPAAMTAGAESVPAGKEPYFGSVRFFKNMILLAVMLAIALPAALAANFYRAGQAKVSELENRQSALNDSLTQLQARYDQMAAEKLAQERLWAGSVAEKVVQAEPLAYQELYPDFYVTEPMGAPVQDDKTMYLTFDDGPSSNTPLLLTVLRNKDVKATFFVVGGGTERQRQWMRDIVEEGHTLGMHSYTHRYHEIYASVEAFLDDYYKLYTAIKEATGQAPTIFRFPGGSVNGYNYPVYREIVAEMLRRGFVFYDWNLSSGDAASNYISPKKITSNILDNATSFSRGIVLLHDAPSKDSTVESLAGVIDGLREQGFALAPLTREVRPIVFSYTDYQPK